MYLLLPSKSALKHKKCTFFEKNCIFFQKWSCIRATPSHFTTLLYLRTPPWSCTMFDQFPRSYGRKMQPMTPIFPTKCTFFEKNCIFFQKYLVMCIFCCTFALAFEKEVRHKVTVLSSSGLGQRPLTP